MRRRAGLSVLEIVVAIGVLAGSVAALMTMSSGESRGVQMSEQRLTAIMLLTELQQTLGGKSWEYYQAFPTQPDGWDPLTETLVLDHVTVFDHRDTADTRPIAAQLRAAMAQMKVERYVVRQPFTTSTGLNGDVVTYVVTYESNAGVRKEVSTFEVVYKTDSV
jgi:type II secretory pathway pseudopilin PulG